MSKLDEYRDAQEAVTQLQEVSTAIQADAEVEDSPRVEAHAYIRIGKGADEDRLGLLAYKAFQDAIGHHLPVIIETALGLAGASLQEAKAQAALEAAATLTELQPVEDLAEGA